MNRRKTSLNGELFRKIFGKKLPLGSKTTYILDVFSIDVIFVLVRKESGSFSNASER